MNIILTILPHILTIDNSHTEYTARYTDYTHDRYSFTEYLGWQITNFESK